MTTTLKGTLFGVLSAAAFAAAPAWTQTAPATDPATAATATAIQVANSGKRPIVAVYTSPPGRADWSDDMLGKGTIKPGQSAKLKLKAKPDGCKVDISAMLDNGESRTQSGVNLCAADPPNVGF